MMHAGANRTDVPDKSRWVRASGICRWDAIQSRHVRAHHTTRTHTFLRSEHQTSKQKIPTESLQSWIPPPSTLVLCERGWVTGLSGNPRSQCACANGGCVRPGTGTVRRLQSTNYFPGEPLPVAK